MILDPHVDRIMLTGPLPPLLDPDTSAFTALKTLMRTARQARAQQKRFAVTMSGAARPLLGPHGQPPYLVEVDYSLPLADVVLDPGATAILERSGDAGIVSLERDPGAGVPRRWSCIRVSTGSGRSAPPTVPGTSRPWTPHNGAAAP